MLITAHQNILFLHCIETITRNRGPVDKQIALGHVPRHGPIGAVTDAETGELLTARDLPAAEYEDMRTGQAQSMIDIIDRALARQLGA